MFTATVNGMCQMQSSTAAQVASLCYTVGSYSYRAHEDRSGSAAVLMTVECSLQPNNQQHSPITAFLGGSCHYFSCLVTVVVAPYTAWQQLSRSAPQCHIAVTVVNI